MFRTGYRTGAAVELTRIIGGAGRLVPQKNFSRFLRIAKVLTEIDGSYRFVIAGSGPLETELKREAVQLGVNVEWFGVEASLDRFFEEIDLYLLTSDFEGLPMTLLEALQQGVPVSAMAVDGIREEFSDEILLLDPSGNERELGQRIHSAIQNQPECAKMVQRGKEIVSRRFSARQQIREMEQVYVDLLREKSVSSSPSTGVTRLTRTLPFALLHFFYAIRRKNQVATPKVNKAMIAIGQMFENTSVAGISFRKTPLTIVII